MKSFWGLLLLAAAASASVLVQRGVRELSESDIDIIKKSKEIKEALQAEHRAPTEEEHAVLAQWEQIHENKQDELKTAGIIDRRASVPVDRAEREIIRKLDDLTLTKQVPRIIPQISENEEEHELTADELNVILMAALIASDLEEKNRQPTEDEAGVLLLAVFITMANEDELRREGLFGQPQFANQVQFREVGSAETREVANKHNLRVTSGIFNWRRQLAASEDDESGKKLKYIRYIPIYQ